eukprot:GFYU01004336.1.p1 GENE.GFYU01004336.1~~GFYU01004336.1.p1  ORF type:complete len:338 (-),score=80.38 GFYU01004336.1:213-1226(-)
MSSEGPRLTTSSRGSIEEGYSNFDAGRNIHYRIVGSNNPGIPVVCVHGIGAYSYHFDLLAEALAQQNRLVVLFDFLDRGNSSASSPDTVFTLDYYLKQMSCVLDTLKERLWGKKNAMQFDLVGHSLGGCISTQYTYRHPENVRKLVLMAPAGLQSSPFILKALRGKCMGPCLQSLFAGGLRKKNNQVKVWKDDYKKTQKQMEGDSEHKQALDNLNKMLECQGWQYDAQGEAWRRALLKTFVQFEVLPQHNEEAVRGLGANKSMDIMVMWGAHDKIIGIECAQRWKELIPHSKSKQIDAAHAFFLEEPEATHAEILPFLGAGEAESNSEVDISVSSAK